MCNGQTFEESKRFIELTIVQHGWALRGVYPGVDDPGGGHWTHTVGLLESFNHPELVITDTEYSVAGELLNGLGEEIRAGGDITQISQLQFHEVHQAHLDSELLAAWWNNYGHAPAPGQVWQVVLPETNYCACHGHLRTDLRDASQFPGKRRPNRAQRRALNRARRTHRP